MIEASQLSVMKTFINGVAKKQNKKLPLLLEKHSDEATKSDLVKLPKTITRVLSSLDKAPSEGLIFCYNRFGHVDYDEIEVRL